MYKYSEMFLLMLVCSISVTAQYTPPQPKVLPLYPRGLQISIPDEEGISLVAYHIKFNEEFDGLEAGTIAKDVVTVRGGRWNYVDRNTQLRFDDVIHYWVHVIYNGLGYNLLNQQHRVNAFYDQNGRKVLANDGTGTEHSKPKDCATSSTKLIDLSNGSYQDTCEGELLLHEEFDRFNKSLWRRVEEFDGAPDYAFVAYRNRDLNIKVKNGKLLITPTLTESEFNRAYVRRGNLTLEKCTGEIDTSNCQRYARGYSILPPVMSGYADTKKSFAFLYGRVEIRAKLSKGDWIYPILALQPLENAKETFYPQLRVAASSGNVILHSSGGADLSGHVLSGGGIQRTCETPGSSTLAKRFSSNCWSDEYHVYQLEWTNSRIAVKVDGVEYGSTKSEAPFDKPYYIALGNGVGGFKEFPDMCESDGYVKPWRNVGSKALFEFYNTTDLWTRTWENDDKDLKVDYIKIWAV